MTKNHAIEPSLRNRQGAGCGLPQGAADVAGLEPDLAGAECKPVAASEQTASLRHGPECRVSSRQADVTRFADSLSEFLDVHREAAAYGPTQELSSKYDVLREELRSEYPLIRPALAAHFDPSSNAHALGFDFHGLWSDPVERLTAPDSLEDALRLAPGALAKDALHAVRALDRCWRAIGRPEESVGPCD
jgi:hypothetical protein